VEINADFPKGASDDIKRAISENAMRRRFQQQDVGASVSFFGGLRHLLKEYQQS